MKISMDEIDKIRRRTSAKGHIDEVVLSRLDFSKREETRSYLRAL